MDKDEKNESNQKSICCEAEVHEACLPSNISGICHCSCHPTPLEPARASVPALPLKDLYASAAARAKEELAKIVDNVGSPLPAQKPQVLRGYATVCPPPLPPLKDEVAWFVGVWEEVRSAFPKEVPVDVLIISFQHLIATRRAGNP